MSEPRAYDVETRQVGSWGSMKWQVTVDTTDVYAPPCMALHDHADTCRPEGAPISHTVGYGYAWTLAGAERKASRIVRRDKRDRSRAAATLRGTIRA